VASEYDDGVAAGKIVERLDHHDRHFQTINGSIDRLADHTAKLVLELQRLADQAVARDATAVALAAALKEAEASRRAQGEHKWSPVSRTITVILAVVAVAGVILTIVAMATR
jgi:hypothetical protein